MEMLIKFSGWSSIRTRRWNGSEVKMYRALTGPRTQRKRALCLLIARLLEIKSKSVKESRLNRDIAFVAVLMHCIF